MLRRILRRVIRRLTDPFTLQPIRVVYPGHRDREDTIPPPACEASIASGSLALPPPPLWVEPPPVPSASDGIKCGCGLSRSAWIPTCPNCGL